jgi:uncharacterized 2Fe-2S/4Fe-4S cluster protein (DUF4445 family)
MATLRARHGERTATTQVRGGTTLREALERTGLNVRTGCNGNGSCGLCRVRVLAGAVSAATDQERLNLGPALLDAGVRLACQAAVQGDVDLIVESLALRTAWSPIPPGNLAGPGRRPGFRPQDAALRLALDVGTTNLNLTLWNGAGERLASLCGLNPQAGLGADVVTRLQAARDPAVARQLARTVEQAVAAAVQDFAPPGATCSILAVGNTAMLALLQGAHGGLLDPETWAGPAPSTADWGLRWELFGHHEAAVALVPPLGGFVGSDLLAACLAADLRGGESPALLVDFGTNTEIALWDGATLWVTSAAGGPAFEACGLRCAVPAGDGAIARVRAGTPFGFEVMGGGGPKGVCGTGLVDWIACLVESGMLDRRGNFRLGSGESPSLGEPGRGIMLEKRDVDLFQRAKAAIGAAIQVLLGRAGLASADLRRVISTGLFGRGLDIANAQAIGLLPRVPVERVEAHCNLALAGCEAMLAAAEGARAVEPLRARARLVNMARCAEFEDFYVQGLHLGPLGDP